VAVVVTAGKGRHVPVAVRATWSVGASAMGTRHLAFTFFSTAPSFLFLNPFPITARSLPRQYVPTSFLSPLFLVVLCQSSFTISAREREERTLSIHTHGDMGAGSGVVQAMNSVHATGKLLTSFAAGRGRPRTYVRRPWCS
jgi:hypothetical protein